MKLREIKGFQHKKMWVKGNLHSHTTNSDGTLTPQESVAMFRSHGYQFLCLSDHDKYTDYREAFNTENFIILPGLEASVILGDRKTRNILKVHHIHGILGTTRMQQLANKPLLKHGERVGPIILANEWNGEEEGQKLVDLLRSRGCITTYNHPIWSKVSREEVIPIEGLTAIEVFNYNTQNECGLGYDTTFWDAMLRAGKRIHALATDDNHNPGTFPDACGGYIVANVEELTHDEVITSIVEGNYYSTAGPQIYDWGIKNDTVYVSCSEVNRINFIAGNCVGAGGTVLCSQLHETMTFAEYTLRGNESYVRVECVDRFGRTAWTNALFI